MKMCEEPIIIKLGLSAKCLGKALCYQKGALGIGLMKPRTIVNMIKLKLFISNEQKNGNAKLAIECQEEFYQVEARRCALLGEDPKIRC